MRASAHRAVLLVCALAAAARIAVAGFAGVDVFLPMVGRQAGVHPSNWYTTVWIRNPGAAAATARIYLLERNTANPSPPWVDVLLAPGDTEKVDNIVETLFHREVFGALRVTCATQALEVTSRVYSRGAGADDRDSVGQDFAGVPASFAIGPGERSSILGVHQTVPAGTSELRFNFGFVETTGNAATVRVRAFDGNDAAQGAVDLQVREWSQRQVAFKDHFPGVSTENTRLEVEVIGGSGRVIAYGSGIANGSQDPTTFEMAYPPELLTANAAAGIEEVAAGQGLAGGGAGGTVTLDVGAGAGIEVGADTVGIAPGGVTGAMLAGNAVTSEKIADGAVQAADLAFAPGDITAVTAGAGLSGGAQSGDAALAVAVPLVLSGSVVAPGAVVSASTTGTGRGVLGLSTNGYGVRGESATSDGVSGSSDTGPGVRGLSSAGEGVRGFSQGLDGVVGSTGSASHAGVHGYNLVNSAEGFLGHHDWGVRGEKGGNWGVLASGNYGAYAENATGVYGYLASDDFGALGRNGDNWGRLGTPNYAGYFNGDVHVTDDVTVGDDLSVTGTKSFRIDHPLDPENRYLFHAAVESGEVLNVYSGNAVLDAAGEAVVALPEWFDAINRDLRYQLTCVGGFAPVYVAGEVVDNRFRIGGGRPGLKVSWQVTGVRDDAVMRSRPFAAERDKPEGERGTYLAPEAHGRQPDEGLEWRAMQAVPEPAPEPGSQRPTRGSERK